MPEIKELESKNLHNVMWTFSNKGETSLLDKIFKGDSAFDDGGTLEVIEGFPEGVDIPSMPESPQEFSPGLDYDLKDLAKKLQIWGVLIQGTIASKINKFASIVILQSTANRAKQTPFFMILYVNLKIIKQGRICKMNESKQLEK